MDGTIVSIVRDAEKFSRPDRFWGMSSIEWNVRNLKRPVPLSAVFVIGISLYEVLWGFYNLLVGHLIGVAMIAVAYFMGFTFGAVGLTYNIDEDNSHDKYSLLRKWVIFESYKRRRALNTVKSLHEALAAYTTPVPREHYVLRHEQLRKLRTPMLAALGGATLILVAAAYLQVLPNGGLYFEYLFLGLMSVTMMGASASDLYELYYSPVLFGEFSEGAEDALFHGLGVDVDQVLRAFDARGLFSRVRFKAFIGYALGFLSGFNIWALAEPLICLMLLAMYIALPSLANAESLPIPYSVLVALIAGLFVYSVVHSWREGGGYSKAMRRKAMLWSVISSFSLSELMSKDHFREVVASASYSKAVSVADDSELIARMVVESLPGTFR